MAILSSLMILPACDIPRITPSDAPTIAAVLVFILGNPFSEKGITDTAAKAALVITMRGNIDPIVRPITLNGC